MQAETTMTVGWIAERLAMGTRGYLNHLLYRRRKLSEELFNDNYSSPRGKNNRRRTRSSQYQELTPLQGVANIKNGPLH